MSEKITIDDLYSDTGAFNQEAALRALKNNIVFTRENEIVFNIDPEKLKARDSILLYALAKKVLKANEKIEDETVINSEIINKTKINRTYFPHKKVSGFPDFLISGMINSAAGEQRCPSSLVPSFPTNRALPCERESVHPCTPSQAHLPA